MRIFGFLFALCIVTAVILASSIFWRSVLIGWFGEAHFSALPILFNTHSLVITVVVAVSFFAFLAVLPNIIAGIAKCFSVGASGGKLPMRTRLNLMIYKFSKWKS